MFFTRRDVHEVDGQAVDVVFLMCMLIDSEKWSFLAKWRDSLCVHGELSDAEKAIIYFAAYWGVNPGVRLR